MTKGGPAQPNLGLEECADDPFETPLSQFKIIPINPGSLGDFINATPDLSINLFYCSDTTTVTTSPVECFGL